MFTNRRRFPSPLQAQRKPLNRLPSYCKAAVEEAGIIDLIPPNHIVRLEQYRIEDIRHLVEKIWQWDCHLTHTMDHHDTVRVENIIHKVKKGADLWPYVSYFTDKMEGLLKVDDQRDVVNHGDGWHRLIAAVELRRTEAEFLFIERLSGVKNDTK